MNGKEITNYNLTKIYKDSSNNTINNIMLNKVGYYGYQRKHIGRSKKSCTEEKD